VDELRRSEQKPSDGARGDGFEILTHPHRALLNSLERVA